MSLRYGRAVLRSLWCGIIWLLSGLVLAKSIALPVGCATSSNKEDSKVLQLNVHFPTHPVTLKLCAYKAFSKLPIVSWSFILNLAVLSAGCWLGICIPRPSPGVLTYSFGPGPENPHFVNKASKWLLESGGA